MITLRVGDFGELPADAEAMARAIWSVAIGSDGGSAPLAMLSRILDCAGSLCSLGVEPCEAIGLLRWIDAPDAFKSVAREAWAAAVSSGAVTRVAWPVVAPADGSGLGAATVGDALSRVLTLPDGLRVLEPERHRPSRGGRAP